MRLDDIKEFELDFSKPIHKSSDIDKLIEYNKHDVLATLKFLELSMEHIQFRDELSKEYKHNIINFNESKIGEWYMTDQLEKVLDFDDMYYRDEDNKKKKKGTTRNIIPLKEVIFDYIKFTTPEFDKLLSFLKELKVFIIKGKFQWNENDDYINMIKAVDSLAKEIKMFGKPIDADDEAILNKMKDKHKLLSSKYVDHDIVINIDNCEFVIGKGGLHGINKVKVFHKKKDTRILDVDVTSFYPCVGIENRLYPEHLGTKFCDIYGQVMDQRLTYDKGTIQNKILKIALNGSYGKTNSAHSVLYDPKYTLSTTINGQLLLLMLWDKLRVIDTVELIQANTDGLTLYHSDDVADSVRKTCEAWEKYTRLNLEYVDYKMMLTGHVNAYIAVHDKLDENGKVKVKQKGVYAFDNLPWDKDFSNLIVRKAVYEYYLHGKSISKFITEHEDIFDFFKCTNANRSTRIITIDPLGIDEGKPIYRNQEFRKDGRGYKGKPNWSFTDGQEVMRYHEHQRVSRYIISNVGQYMYKVMKPLPGKTDPRFISIEAGEMVDVYNTVTSHNAKDYDINYDYYIREAEKLMKYFKV